VEASLLPSTEIREICQKTPMAVVPRGDAAKELEKEFQLRARSPVFVVLDAKGETLAKVSAEDIGVGCTKETVAQFPRLVAERMTSCLARGETLEALERAWAVEKTTSAGTALAARLEEQKDFRRLADLCETLPMDFDGCTSVKSALGTAAVIVMDK